jgi:CBS domain containing-hemolysin-like protein
MTPSGYLFVTEADGDEITAAVRLQGLSDFSAPHLERYAQPVIYVPWCVTVADTLQRLSANDREAAVVVNELGETIGVLTLDDILDAVFMERSGRSERLLNREAIQMIRPGLWQVTGLTNLRRLSDYFAADLPPTHSATVSGVVQECLQRLPRPGDECQWGPFRLNVVEASDNGQILVHINRVVAEQSP